MAASSENPRRLEVVRWKTEMFCCGLLEAREWTRQKVSKVGQRGGEEEEAAEGNGAQGNRASLVIQRAAIGLSRRGPYSYAVVPGSSG